MLRRDAEKSTTTKELAQQLIFPEAPSPIDLGQNDIRTLHVVIRADVLRFSVSSIYQGPNDFDTIPIEHVLAALYIVNTQKLQVLYAADGFLLV